MSQEQLQEPLLEPIVESKEEHEEKPKKKARKQMSPEHKERLLQGLIAARAKKAELALLEDKKVVEKIKEKVDQVKPSKEVDLRDLEIKELKKKLDGLTLQDVVKPKRKTKPKTIPEESEDEKPTEKKPRKPRAKKEKVEKEKVVENESTSIAQHIQQAPSIIFKSLRGSRMKKY
jgi:hypothetical protein